MDIYGIVGSHVTLADVRAELADTDPDQQLTVHIASDGGSFSEGLAIYNLLKQRGNVTTVVDSLAASIASVIALAGETLVMQPGSVLMIHEANTEVYGLVTTRDVRELMAAMDTVNESISAIYSESLNQDVETIVDWMQAETWFTSTEAIEAGWPVTLENSAVQARLSIDTLKATYRQRIAAHYRNVAGTPAGTFPIAAPRREQILRSL